MLNGLNGNERACVGCMYCTNANELIYQRKDLLLQFKN